MGGFFQRRRWSLFKQRDQASEAQPATEAIPPAQSILLLEKPREPYRLVEKYPIPELLKDGELLVKTSVIGLNPIDWKAPDFNFGIPELPYISGRESSGTVVKTSPGESLWTVGDKVIAISTDYRDLRKAAYQQYSVALGYNLVRIPPATSFEDGATLGVAFVAAALALGVCFGADFSSIQNGPNTYQLLREMCSSDLPSDVREECLNSVESHERVRRGDWIAVWGGSSTSANLIVQLSRLLGLKVVVVVDKAKHGLRLSSHQTLRPDLLVDSHDPQRAVQIIRANTKGKLRFGIDTRGKESAANLLQALTTDYDPSLAAVTSEISPPSPPATPLASAMVRAHLVGLTGLPKTGIPEGCVLHNVPIKLFHEVPVVGSSLSNWLGRLLEQNLIVAPEIVGIEQGLSSINAGLDRMRRGEISGGKLVVRV